MSVLLAMPALASATTRYASPSPAGDATCAADSPCGLGLAMSLSVLPGDEVVLAPGDYTLEETLSVPAGVTVRGTDGAPRPVLHGNSANTLVAADTPNATLRHLTIRQDGNNGVALHAAALAPVPIVLDRLFIEAAGAESIAAELGLGATLSNSVAWSSSSVGDGVHVVASGAALNNVTAWASGANGNGIRLNQLTETVATNTIARAPAAAAPDGADIANFDLAAATIVMTNSNFGDTHGPVSAAGPGNNSAFPSLVAPDAGDFHQLRPSPTVDAGIPNPASLGADFDGQARFMGAAPDVGADEFLLQTPAAATGAASDVTRNSATLNGTVDANGLPTTYRFEYGLTPLYGNTTAPADAGAGSEPVPVSQALTNLAPGSIVHYRLVASNADGETAGLDQVLVVLGNPPGASDLPRFTELSLPSTAVVGQPVVLEVSGRDPDSPLNSIVVDFDDGESFYAASACRLRPPDPAFRENRRRDFSVPYTFTQPGIHTVEVTLGSGDCGRREQTTTQTIQIDVQPAAKLLTRVRASQIETPTTAGAACKNADLVPTSGNRGKVQNATVCVLNYVRRQNGLKPFRKNKKLRRASAFHNRNMLRGGFFAHQGPGEPALGARLRRMKYRGGAGENLGAGAGVPYATARGMVDGWMNSPVHKANILERAFRTVGISVMPRKPFEPPVPGAVYTAAFGTTRR